MQALAELDVRYNRTFNSCLPVQRVTLSRSSEPSVSISCFNENLSQCPNREFFVSSNYSASNDGSPGFNFSMTLNVSRTVNETFAFSIVVTTSVSNIEDTPTVLELSNTASSSAVILPGMDVFLVAMQTNGFGCVLPLLAPCLWGPSSD